MITNPGALAYLQVHYFNVTQNLLKSLKPGMPPDFKQKKADQVSDFLLRF